LLQFLVKYYLSDHFRKDKKGTSAACMGGEGKFIQKFDGKI